MITNILLILEKIEYYTDWLNQLEIAINNPDHNEKDESFILGFIDMCEIELHHYYDYYYDYLNTLALAKEN